MLLQHVTKQPAEITTSLGVVKFGPGGMLNTDDLPEQGREKLIEKVLAQPNLCRPVTMEVPTVEQDEGPEEEGPTEAEVPGPASVTPEVPETPKEE